MPVQFEYTDEQRRSVVDRIGNIFGITDPGQKISRDGVRLESIAPGKALLRVELITVITEDEANAIITAAPLPDDTTSTAAERTDQ